MRKLILLGVLIIMSASLFAQSDSRCQRLADSIEAMEPSALFDAITAEYKLICVIKNGQPVGNMVVQRKYSTLRKTVKAYDKIDYRKQEGSDYGLWDYRSEYKGDRYAVLNANQAVNRMVQRSYYFKRVDE